MTKEEALRFKEGWAVVNQFVIDEARRTTPEERLRSLNSLYISARLFGWNENLRTKEEQAVRERWRRLREKFGGGISYGQ